MRVCVGGSVYVLVRHFGIDVCASVILFARFVVNVCLLSAKSTNRNKILSTNILFYEHFIICIKKELMIVKVFSTLYY